MIVKGPFAACTVSGLSFSFESLVALILILVRIKLGNLTCNIKGL